MALMELINAARQRQAEREKARLQAERERDMARFKQHLADVFEEGFVEQAGGQVRHDGDPHVAMQYMGNTYRLYMQPNRDASKTWMVNDRELFIHGRQPEQAEAVDLAALAIADLAQAEQEPVEPQPATETVRLEEPVEQPQ